jgi:hypothetical protein
MTESPFHDIPQKADDDLSGARLCTILEGEVTSPLFPLPYMASPKLTRLINMTIKRITLNIPDFSTRWAVTSPKV